MLTAMKRPFVILNAAITADGKTDTVARKGAAISSAEDMQRVDQLRADVDAIMVGGRTLTGDDPRLTVKSEHLRQERIQRGQSANPVKVGVITVADLPPESRFLSSGPAQVIVFTTAQSKPEHIERLQRAGVSVYRMGEQQVDLVLAMQKLAELGIQRLLVEGGGILIESLLKLLLVDEVNIYVAPLIFGGAGAPTLASGSGLSRDEALHLQLIDVSRMGPDGVLLKYQPNYQ
jgi:2,5-diamino-6-(ribosylamino)-4(3H)-pyrimidinone 5'-phosphate reductase